MPRNSFRFLYSRKLPIMIIILIALVIRILSGVILKIFGATRPVFYVQAVIGALTVIFIEQIGRRFFGSIAGLTAAFLYAIYVPFFAGRRRIL